MTLTGDFFTPLKTINNSNNLGQLTPRPLGLSLLPKVQAILLGLLGIGGAFAIYNYLVNPTLEERRDLEAQVAEKEAQIQQQEASLQENCCSESRA